MTFLWLVLALIGGGSAASLYFFRAAGARNDSEKAAAMAIQAATLERVADELGRQRALVEHQAKAIEELGIAHSTLLSSIQAQAQLDASFESPIRRLTFEESLVPDLFDSAARQSALSRLTEVVQANAADGISVTVNSVRFVGSRVEMLVKASTHGDAMMREGTAIISRTEITGLGLPIIRDVKTGKVLEVMKEARVTSTVSRVANLATVAISAAHIISGADISKRLKLLDGKMDFLLATRRTDQISRLERIYGSAKELANAGYGLPRRQEFWRLRNELRELRIAWRREVEYRLTQIENPEEAGWFRRTFTKTQTFDRGVHRQVTEGQMQLRLIEYSVLLDQALAYESDSMSLFEQTLSEELPRIKGVATLLEEKGAYISGLDPALSVDPLVRDINAMIDGYSKLLPVVEKLVEEPSDPQ
jgi:hypothetical protein